MCTAVEETNIEVILAVMNTTELVAEIKPENNNLCDTGAALYQLSYIRFFNHNAHICFHIFTMIIHHLGGLFGTNIMTSSQLAC